MERSRAARRERVRSRRKQLLIAAAVCAGLLLIAGGIASVSRLYGSQPQPKRVAKATSSAEVETPAIVASSTATTETPVEVPNVTGRTLTEAQLVLQTAGFVVISKGETMT